MALVGSMVASLTLESASFMSGMKKAAEETSRTQRAIQANLDRITTGVQSLAAVLAVDMFAQATKAALDYADAIVDLSDRTGASTKFIQEFGYAAQLAGSDVETARTGLEKFSKQLGDAANGNEAAKKKMAEYGITALDVDTAVKQAAETIQKMDNPTKQLAATMDLFGKKAGTLTQTLAGGTEGLELQARAARDLGIVLEDSVIRNAGKANDKLDTMKMILDARMANTIAQNADSIVSLADGVMRLAGAIVSFHQSNPAGAYAIMGALAGYRVGGGYGALIGGAIGGVLGTVKGIKDREASNDLGIRTEELRGETNRVKTAIARGASKEVVDRLLGHLNDSRARMDRALKAHNAASAAQGPKPTTTETIGLPKPTGGSHKSGPSSAELAQKEAERQARYASDLLRGQMGIIRSGGILDSDSDLDYYRKLAASTDTSKIKDGDDITVTGMKLDRASRLHQEAMLGGDIDIRYDNTKREILQKYEEQLAQLNVSVKKGDIKAGSEEQTVKAQILYQKLLDENAAAWEYRVERDRQAAETELTALSIQQDTLSLQSSLADTAKDRRRIALELLDIETRQRDKALEAQQVGLDPNTAEYKDLQARRDALKSQSGLMRGNAMKNTMGPLEGFLDSIPSSADKANEALQNIAVQGLSSLNDGIADAILGAKDFGEAFADTAKMVIKALISMALQMAIIQPLGNILGSALGVPMKANGGLSSGGMTIVGERGAELVDLPGGSNVIPNHALSSIAGGGRSGNVINIDARGSTDEAAVHEAVMRGIQQATPQIVATATQATIRKFGRPSL